MSDVIRELEELSFRTLPALEQERYDGWVLRWSDGGSRRGNSINPMGPSSVGIEEKVVRCEEWFAGRGSPAIFRLTPLADAGLAAVLATKGYTQTSPTDVLVLRIGDPTPVAAVDVDDHPDDWWLATVTGHEPGSAEGRQLAAQLMAGVGRLHFASVLADGPEAVATGMSVDLGRFATIYSMNTHRAYRRRGMARSVLNTLLAVGKDSGSTHAVLQVTQDNAAAQNLYREFGFEPVYQYSYMEADQAG